MPYDTMTENEWDEYQTLYSNPTNSVRERAERFLYFAEKGWTGTRAADDCFEMGNDDLVLALVLEQVRANPEFENLLKSQGAWSKDWDEYLRDWDKTPKPIIEQLDWDGITIELLYKPQWLEGVEGTAHLAIQTIEPFKAPLPITGTGYKSHFFHGTDVLTEEELIAAVQDWLNEKAQTPEWQTTRQDQQQLTLF